MTAAPKQSPWILEATAESFAKDVIERSHELPVVVDFWASWCQPCRMLAPLLEKLADEYGGKFLLVKAETERLPQIAAEFNVQSIPAVYGLRHGELVDMFVGVLPEPQLRAWLDRLLPSPAEVLTAEADRLAKSDAPAAEAKYREAIGLAPQLAAAKISLAGLLLDQQRADEARTQIDELAARGYLEPAAERLKARLDLDDQGQQAGSVENCRAAVAAAPGDFDRQLKLAEALAGAAEYEEALQIALGLVAADRKRSGESARKLMVDIFHLLPADSELTGTYRRRLSAALY